MDIRPFLLLAKTMSAQHKLTVEFSRDSAAYCSWNKRQGFRIVLPILDCPEADKLYKGYIDHEVGHARFTDFGIEAPMTRDVHTLVNIFEDEFVERKMGEAFPGCRGNLRWLARYVFTEEHREKLIASGIKSALFAFALYKRRALLDNELGKSADKIADALTNTYGVKPQDLDAMTAKLAEASASSVDNKRLAEELRLLFAPYLQSQDRQDQSQSGQDQQQSKQSQSGQDQAQSGQSQDGQDSFDDKQFSVSDMANKAMSANRADIEEVRELERASRIASTLARVSDKEFFDQRTRPVAIDERVLSALSRRIPPLLQSRAIKPCVIGSRGRLCNKRLARVMTLDPNVFYAPATRIEQSLEIGFLLDYSGSMWQRVDVFNPVICAALAMLKTLPGIKSFAAGFQGLVYRILCRKDQRRFTRFPAMIPNGDTPLSAAMINAAAEFDITGRRLLFVTTDGQPNETLDVTAETVKWIKRLGIELYAIGIAKDAEYVGDIFGEDNSIFIENINQFAPQLEALLRKSILR